jgi:phosphoribosyl-dephospho-CoA transferase
MSQMSCNTNVTQLILITVSTSYPIKTIMLINHCFTIKILHIYYIWAKNIIQNVLQASY